MRHDRRPESGDSSTAGNTGIPRKTAETLKRYEVKDDVQRSINVSRILQDIGVVTKEEVQRTKSGAGPVFHEHQQYVPGMDSKLVDWKASARRGSLIVKQGREEGINTNGKKYNIFIDVENLK